jgi:hypothetical protein
VSRLRFGRSPSVFYRRLLAVGVAASLLLSLVFACGCGDPPPVSLGTYVTGLCEALGPFERDAKRLGRVVAKVGVGARSRQSEAALNTFLTAGIADSHGLVAKLQAIGAPDVSGGTGLASAMIATFHQIETSDATWQLELRTRHQAWLTVSRVTDERLRTSLGALVLVGDQFEHLPHTSERENAMARSPVCRNVFGSLRVGEQHIN